MAENLTMQDILDEQIDSEAYQETPNKKFYRQKKGSYSAFVHDMRIKENASGRRYVSLFLKLYDKSTKGFRGTTFCDASWKMVRKQDGTPDHMFKLFSLIVQAIKAPTDATIDKVLPAIVGEWFDVWGTEYFLVDAKDVPEEKSRGDYQKVKVFINDEEDSLAEYLLRLGYESKLFVHNISPIQVEKQTPQEDDDIPF